MFGFPCVPCAVGGGFRVFSGKNGGEFFTADCTDAGFARHGSTQIGGSQSVYIRVSRSEDPCCQWFNPVGGLQDGLLPIEH